MVITDGGQVIRTRVSEIRETGRNAQGVRIIRLNEGEHVVDVEPVATEGDEPTGETVRPPPPSEPPPADGD
jgi:DNA gyrase subunit A